MRPVIFIRPIYLPKTPHYVPLWQRHVEYPKFTPGDPPIRCFLTPFWMKMIYPGPNNPTDQVIFKVHPQMTTSDVHQYLEKIYNTSVLHVRLKMCYHDLEPMDQPPIKTFRRALDPFLLPPKPERYEKLAYVRLPPGTTFEFPNLFKTKSPSSDVDAIESSGATDDTTSKSLTDSATVTSSPSETKPPTSHKKLPSWFIR
ncbi:54S ribosomal protein L23, mitochondrial [Clonorchis sinensis]|uniref:Large ribosomal subunit protein uL23m n=2 Tax=Clonorchis sinensis TaxID=79923 RepID=A0A8T1MFC8_CLOSI|nr:54S ribosomal protein L23, mitochondrial [Clonorchis sinensis]